MALSFVVSSGGWLSWTSDNGEPMGVSSAFIEDLASIELKAPNGQRLATLDVEGAWGGHSVNGTVTASVADFVAELASHGFNVGQPCEIGDEGKVPFYQLMDEVGDGSGNSNMAVNGSTTPITFLVKPSSGQVIKLARIITSIRDSGSFDSGGWGNNGGNPLPIGLDLVWKRNGIEYDLTKNKVQSHYDLSSYSYDISHNNWGQGDEFITNRFTFTKAGQYLVLDGDLGDELQVIVNDDLTYLVDQRVSAQGYYEAL